MSSKIIYFTAGTVPTGPELAEIAALNALAAPRYEVAVRDGSTIRNFGTETGDFAGGTVPAVAPYNTYDTFDSTDAPGEVQPDGTVVVKNSAGTVSKNATATVAAGLVDHVALASTVAMKANADTVSVADSASTTEAAAVCNVAAGVVTNVSLPSTDKILKSTVQCPCPAPSGTRTTGYVFTIVNGVITAAVGY